MGKPTGFLEIERNESKEVSPLERIHNFNEFHTPLSKEEQSCQAARCMDCGVPFCQNGRKIQGVYSGCPLNNLIPEWNDLIYHEHYEEAFKRLLLTNNFPEFTSRVCPALCEAACTCSLNGSSVTVRENEHSIIEMAFDKGWIRPQPPKYRVNQKIAIIGSGPAGLAAADQLNKRGYYVTVFERDDRIGGLLMYGIPNMKLEKDIILRRQKIMEEEGVQFITNCHIETKKQANTLLKDYDRIILACGSRVPRDINAKGRDASGIYFAVDYLTSVTKSLLNSHLKDHDYIDVKNKNVVIIGGGDTGNDCVGTSIRLGCKSVVQLELMSELPTSRLESNPWPEWPRVKKTDYGQKEALALFGHDPRLYQTTVKEFIQDKDQLKGVVTVNVKFENGKIQEFAGSEKTIEADYVFIAAGFTGAEKPILDAFSIESINGYETSNKQVYTAGDMRRGQSLVVWAIREGREVAKCIDIDLKGYSNL